MAQRFKCVDGNMVEDSTGGWIRFDDFLSSVERSMAPGVAVIYTPPDVTELISVVADGQTIAEVDVPKPRLGRKPKG